MALLRKNIIFLSFLAFSCAPLLNSMQGDDDSDNSLLLLLGAGQTPSTSSVDQSPDDSGGQATSAPETVMDPLQAETEAYLKMSLSGTTDCEPLDPRLQLDQTRIAVCKYQSGTTTRIRWFPQYRNLQPGFETANQVSQKCNNLHNTLKLTYQSDTDIAVQYAMNFCYSSYRDQLPEPEPDPEPLAVPLEISSWFATMRHPEPGKVYPEVSHLTFVTSANLACRTLEQMSGFKDLVQLWELQTDGRWSQRTDVQAKCAPFSNYFVLQIKPGRMPTLSWYDDADIANYGLNETLLKPETKYRVLLSREIASVPDSVTGQPSLLEVFNELGNISGQAEQWSGIDFMTDTKPCFAAYADRWIYSDSVCNYHNMQTDTAGNQTVKRMGCAILTGPQSRLASPPNCQDPAMFPDVVSGPEPDNAIGDYDSCGYELESMDTDCQLDRYSTTCRKKALKRGVCIMNAGQDNEFVRVYFNFDATGYQNCQGIKRSNGSPLVFYNVTLEDIWGTSLNNAVYSNPELYYQQYRRSACESGNTPVEPEPESNCQNKVNIETSAGRWYETPASSYLNTKGKTVKVNGIHTFWQDELLKLNVNVCAEGWYKLNIQARNHSGPKPEFYGAFHLNLFNSDGDMSYGMSIPASDDYYYTRGTFVYLRKGANQLDARWTNDAYLENVYDANIQIKSARIVPVTGTPPSVSNTKKAGRDFCKTNGRFFGSGNSIFTDQTGLKSSYCFQDLEAGEYELIVRAKNRGSTPADYTKFDLNVQLNGNDAGTIVIPVSSDQYKSGKIRINVYNQYTQISLSWVNPAPTTVSDNEDNKVWFELGSLRLKKVGPVSESELSAYLRADSTWQITTTLIISLLFLIGMLLIRKRRQAAV
ncbi:MAG: hypothetical protein KDK39_01970 [Leptospiraceae bacterium]|nr:hypothetical protein [Leptospiraceae bacterium]